MDDQAYPSGYNQANTCTLGKILKVLKILKHCPRLLHLLNNLHCYIYHFVIYKLIMKKQTLPNYMVCRLQVYDSRSSILRIHNLT